MTQNRFASLRKEEEGVTKIVHVDTIVIASDYFAGHLASQLMLKEGKERILLLCERKEDVYRNPFLGPSKIRGEDNIAGFKALNPGFEYSEIQSPSVFLKDGELKEFGGRSKPEKLLFDETFFTEKAISINEDDWLEKHPIDSELQIEEVFLRSVRKIEAHDLAEPTSFEIETGSHVTYHCRKLLWGAGPKKFLKLFQDKEILHPNFIQYCDQSSTGGELHLEFDLNIALTEEKKTYFLPLSYTHDWGHFVCELKNHGKRVSAVTFINENETTEEEISRKIKIFKRQFEKIFSGWEANLNEEKITFVPETELHLDEGEALVCLEHSLENLSFVSVHAPFEQSKEERENFEDSISHVSYLVQRMQSLTKRV